MTEAQRQRKREYDKRRYATRTPEKQEYDRARKRVKNMSQGQRDRERVREERRRYAKYGITAEEFKAMLIDQRGCCKICLEPSNLCIDHCHTTNKIRGLLCDNCNTAIGLLADSPDRTRRALDYLISHAGTGSLGTG